MNLTIEDIEKINKEISDGLQESCTMRWWKSLLQVGIMILLFASCAGSMWIIPLFTKEIIPYFIVMIVWLVLIVWFVFTGFDYIEMKIYFWRKSKKQQNL